MKDKNYVSNRILLGLTGRNEKTVETVALNELLSKDYAAMLLRLDREFSTTLVIHNLEIEQWDESGEKQVIGTDCCISDEVYKRFPFSQLLVHLGLIEIDFDFIDRNKSQKTESLVDLFALSCFITDHGAEIGLEFNLETNILQATTGRRTFLKIFKIDHVDSEMAVARFYWKWEPNLIWKCLDESIQGFNSIPKLLSENMAKCGIRELYPPSLSQPKEGVGDFFYGNHGWRLHDVTLDEDS